MDKTNRERNQSHRMFYWLVCDYEGKHTLIFGGDSEDQARTRGLELLSGIDFTIRPLATRSLPRASSLLKGSRLEQTHSLKAATQRLGHDKSLALWKHRQEQRRRLAQQ